MTILCHQFADLLGILPCGINEQSSAEYSSCCSSSICSRLSLGCDHNSDNGIVHLAKILQSTMSKFVDQDSKFLDMSDDSSALRIEFPATDVHVKSPSPPPVDNSSAAEAVSLKHSCILIF